MKNLPDIFFLPEWGQAFQELDKGEACIFEFNHKLGHIYYQFIKRKIPDNLGFSTFYDIITPYGFGGPIILENNPSEREQFLSLYDDAFNKYCLNEDIIAEYVRFNPWLKNHLDFQKKYTIKYNNYTLYTDLTVKDFFMEEFSSRIRNKIRNAEKKGVQLEYDLTGSSVEEFYRLYQLTAEKNNFSDYYRFSLDFLLSTFKLLGTRQFIINAKYENKYISSAIFLDYGDYVHYFLAANDYRFITLNANSMILNEIGKWGKKKGKKQLHLGGAFSDELFAFKKHFTKKGICDFYVGKKIRNEQIYNELIDIKLKKGGINDNSYFPLYRG